MKTEMQQLKENAKEQYASERFSEVSEYIKELVANCEEADYWKTRSAKLELFTLVVHLAIVVIGGIYLEDGGDVYAEFSFILFLIAILRGWVFMSRFARATGELHGAFEILRRLGFLTKVDDDDGDKRVKKVKRRSPFKRFKEFWERMGSTNKQEAYGSV